VYEHQGEKSFVVDSHMHWWDARLYEIEVPAEMQIREPAPA
jgi:hypothetical protein